MMSSVSADDDGAAAGVPDDLQSDVVSLVSGLSAYTQVGVGGRGVGWGGGGLGGQVPGAVTAIGSRVLLPLSRAWVLGKA